MELKQVEFLIKQLMNNKLLAMKKYNCSHTKFDDHLVKLMRLKEKIKQSEKRNAVIDSILN